MRRRIAPLDYGSALDSTTATPRQGSRRARSSWKTGPSITSLSICIILGSFFICLLLLFTNGSSSSSSDHVETGSAGRRILRGGGNDVTDTLTHKEPTIFAIGLIKDLSNAHPNILGWLAEVNCRHGIGLHIVTGARDDGDPHSGRNKLERLRFRIAGDNGRNPSQNEGDHAHLSTEELKVLPGCAPAMIVQEDADKVYGDKEEQESAPTNRVERIAALRDYQRELLRPYYDDIPDSGAVIIIDLDLAALPQPKKVLAVAKQLASLPSHDGESNNNVAYPHDVICAAGVTTAIKWDLWYYDTYATVLLPDTYIHPLQHRLIKSYYAGEDRRLVRSDSPVGNWTQGDIMRYFQSMGKQSAYGTMPVKSCFGGMAIYRAATWFNTMCSYGLDPIGLERYASEADGRPCEHVVFHDCLGRTENGKARIAIMPRFVTLWHKD